MAKEKYSYGYAQEKYKPLKQKEEKYNLKLKKGNYYIIRFDGKEMTATFKIDHQAINKSFFDTMEDTFIEFCKLTQNVIFGYSFSGEISILIRGGCNNKVSIFFFASIKYRASCHFVIIIPQSPQ